MIPTYTLLLTWALLKVAAGNGFVSFQLMEYINPGGKRESGSCCDDTFFGLKCSSKCDHYFVICADKYGRSEAIDSCQYGSAQTSATNNRDNIVFGRYIGSSNPTPNPVNFTFAKWEDLNLKVHVWDADRYNDDLVEKLSEKFRLKPGGRSTRLVLQGRTQLVLNVTVACGPYYFGDHCAIRCIAGPTHTCDPHTGAKTCKPGWTGKNCQQRINACLSNPCRHGTCENRVSSFVCKCNPGFEGDQCTDDINECAQNPNPCAGQICMNTLGSYQCRPVSTEPPTTTSTVRSSSPRPTPPGETTRPSILSTRTLPHVTSPSPNQTIVTEPASTPPVPPSPSGIIPVKTCQANEFTCRSDGTCIPKPWKCDNDKDCLDGSDEADCSKGSCAADQFTCTNGKCINANWKCDGDNDCGDHSDEGPHCADKTCPGDKFKCNNGRCIYKTWLCDQENDCLDHSDEGPQCGKVTCQPTQVPCKDSTMCISKNWLCDGEADCSDESDEDGCEPTGWPRPTGIPPSQGPSSCPAGFVLCPSTRNCISRRLVCNGEDDCTDGWDERGCEATGQPTTRPPMTCLRGQFLCKASRQCVPRSWVCDDEDDCPGGEDEENCD